MSFCHWFSLTDSVFTTFSVFDRFCIHKIQSLVIQIPNESTFNNEFSKIPTGKFQPIGNWFVLSQEWQSYKMLIIMPPFSWGNYSLSWYYNIRLQLSTTIKFLGNTHFKGHQFLTLSGSHMIDIFKLENCFNVMKCNRS